MIFYIIPLVFVLIALILAVLNIIDLGKRYAKIANKPKTFKNLDTPKFKTLEDYYEIERNLKYP